MMKWKSQLEYLSCTELLLHPRWWFLKLKVGLLKICRFLTFVWKHVELGSSYGLLSCICLQEWGFFLYTLVKENFMQVHMLLVQQRLPGKEIWLFKSEFTSVDASSLSVVWGFLLSFFSFFSCSAQSECRWGEVWLFLTMAVLNALHMTQLNGKERLRDETHKIGGQPYGRICSPWL